MSNYPNSRLCRVIGAGCMYTLGFALPVHASDAVNNAVEAEIIDFMGLAEGVVIDLDVMDIRPGESFSLDIALGETSLEVDFSPHSVRSSIYQLVEDRGGSVVPISPGIHRTLSGSIRGEESAVIRGSLLDDGLHCVLRRADGSITWIEPVASKISGHSDRLHIVYDNSALPPSGGFCGTPTPIVAPNDEGPQPDVSSFLGNVVYCTELACDADYEFYQSYGSNSATVQDRIELIINTINAQYESQVAIRHEITQILVRTSSSDPYTSNSAEALLCQFITEWTNNQDVSRDVAHLFTGRTISGSTIGIAADLGDICDTNGGCSGPILYDGAYCLAQSDCCGSLGCATDLTAHELGHLWDGYHCNCVNNTMNSYITCSNSFSNASINSIVAHRNSRNCLDICDDGGGGDPEYCDAVCTDTNYEYIASVAIPNAGISNASGVAGYSDYTAIVGGVEQGSSYAIEVVIGNNEYESDTGGLWIDWNGDMDFEDVGENLSPNWTGVGPYVLTFAIPEDAVIGETRMRIRIHDGDYDSMNACGPATYGEVEDYTLDIREPTVDLCVGDINEDGKVDGADLGVLIGSWGVCVGCPADFNGDNTVNGADLGVMIGAWGVCPG